MFKVTQMVTLTAIRHLRGKWDDRPALIACMLVRLCSNHIAAVGDLASWRCYYLRDDRHWADRPMSGAEC